MPKVGSSKDELIRRWLKAYTCFKYDGSVVFCVVCEKEIKVNKKFQVDQHINTGSHQKRKNENRPTQELLLNYVSKMENLSNFNQDLCKMMILCNIPFHNLDKPEFTGFLEKYTKEKVVSSQTASRYINSCNN